MMRVVLRILKAIIEKIHAAVDPSGFARSIGVDLGKNVTFYGASRATFGSEPWMIRIGNDCHITAGVQFITHDGGTLILRKEIPTLEWTAPIEVGDDVYIGVRTIILPDVKVGNRCIIGAGSVVSKSIPDNSVYAGVPARFICTTDEYLEKMRKKSLGCGDLKGKEKAERIKCIYRERGWFSRDE